MPSAAMPMPNPPLPPSPSTGARQQPNALKLIVLTLASIHALISLTGVQFLLMALVAGEMAKAGGWTIAAITGLSPVAAIVALIHARADRLRHAIVALGVVSLLEWLNYMPSMTNTGPDIATTLGYAVSMLYRYGLPALCIGGILLAIRNRYLILAAAMTSILLIAIVVASVVMAFSIAIYGF